MLARLIEMNSVVFLSLGVMFVSLITVINPFYALPFFIFGHFIEPIQFFPELRTYNPSLLLGYAVLGAWILHVVFTGNFIAAKNKLVGLVLVFIAWTFICSIIGSNATWNDQMMFIRNVMPFFLFVYMVKTKKQVVIVVWVLMLMGGIAALYGLYCLKANIGVRDEGIVRVTSFMSNPNAFGKTLALLIPITMGLLLSNYMYKTKIILSGILILLITGVVITYSRTSMIAMLLCLFLTPVMYFKGKNKIIAFIVTLALVPVFYYAFPLERVKWRAHNRLMTTFQAESAAEVDLGRVESARAGWMMMLQNPIFGVGIGGFGHEYYQLAQQSDDLELVESRYGERGLSAHNLYVQVGGQLGVVGVGLYFLLIVYAYRNAIKAEKMFEKSEEGTLYALSRSLKIFIIAFMVIGVTSSGLGNKLFWIVIALVIVLRRLANDQNIKINHYETINAV